MNDRLAFEVELFADLMVQIDDPFGEREAVFLAAGIDEDTYRNLVQSWRDRFDRDGADLASRFADRYTAKRGEVLEARRRRAGGEMDAADTRFLNADAQSFREEAAKVAREAAQEPQPNIVDRPAAPQREAPSFVLAAAQVAPAPPSARPPASFAGTMDISHAVPKASLPFAPPGEARAAEPAPVSTPRPNVPTGTADISAAVPRDRLPFADGGAPRSVARPPQRLAGTADISAFVPRAATPFAPPAPPPPASASAPPAPRKRLIRFDPQTGQPLPAPIWVDLPPEPEGQNK
jgi:hypothetical protein